MSEVKISCFQTNSSEDPEKNIYLLQKMFNSPKLKNIDLICLPECVAIFSEKKKNINYYLNEWNEKFLELIKKQAKKKKTFILVGSIPKKKKNGKYLNRSLIIDKNGEIKSYYDKINLFDVYLSKSEQYLESRNYDSGKKLNVYNLPWGNLGMSICYDLRFPSLYKSLTRKGANCFSVPAAFTFTTGKAHWHSLLRARAIENGCYVFAPAQSGLHDNGRKTFGHSMIINPWGKILEEAHQTNSIITQKIDLDLVNDVRKKIPSTLVY